MQPPSSPYLDALYTECIDTIAAEYTRLGHTLGWRFLTSPRKTLLPHAPVTLLSLNPGGGRPDPSHGAGSCEAGSAYLHESWGRPAGQAPLQIQVRALFDWLGSDPDDSLSAHFIPFRSPSYEALPARQASWTFAVRLWRHILSQVHPTLVVCLGSEVERGLRDVWGAPDRESEHVSVGWGAYTASLATYGDIVLLRLPHLSRFAVFGREASKAPLATLRQKLTEQTITRLQ
jgi:hypothetical protein